MLVKDIKPMGVYDFYYGMKNDDEPGVLHGIVEEVTDGMVTIKSTTSEQRLTIPAEDVIDISGPEWFALVDEVRAEQAANEEDV